MRRHFRQQRRLLLTLTLVSTIVQTTLAFFTALSPAKQSRHHEPSLAFFPTHRRATPTAASPSPASEDYETMTVAALRALLTSRGGSPKQLRKAELIEELRGLAPAAESATPASSLPQQQQQQRQQQQRQQQQQQ